MAIAIEERWGCVVFARRVRNAVDEVLVQWDCAWVEDGAVPVGQVVAVLMRRVVAGKKQVLVQWKCSWVPVEFADVGAVDEYEARRLEESADEGAGAVPDTVVDEPEPVSVVSTPTRAVKRRRNHGW